MLLSRKWLSEFTDINAGSKEFSDKMTLSGSKVEVTEESEISNVVVGRVAEIRRHENSDHMFICTMDVGKDEPVTVVTGAQNVSQGDLVPVALHGSTLPGGIKITKGNLRGVKSEGMLCSLGELGLTVNDFPYAIEDGILILQEDCKPGDDIRPVLGLDDSVVEFEITNNRPDCFSVIGLAREAAATFETPLRLHEPVVKGSGGSAADYIDVDVEAADLCPRYTARVVTDVKLAPSPKWMRERLRACGVRPINNIVDITNYVMLEYGQPMHAFDYSCISGNHIIVRRAQDGEIMNTLDGTARTLKSSMLVIADEEKPIGLAGVMGGENSEISENTKTVVFESANFYGVSIRKTAIALGMRTDASSLFEKGLDILNTLPAVERACELVELLGAGKVVDGVIDVISADKAPVSLELQPDKIRALLGADIPEDFMVKTLEKLGFTMEGQTIHVPSWRSDIAHYSDIAEEVARFYGYDAIEPTMFAGITTQGGMNDLQLSERRAAQLCLDLGFSQAMTYSFISPSAYDKIGLPADSPARKSATILNPLGEDTSVMRTTPLPSMLDAIARNYSYRNKNVRLYELAKVYLPVEGETLYNERKQLVLAAYGNIDFFALKGCVEALANSFRVELRFKAERNDPSYHPGRCARIFSGDTELGTIGQIHPLIAENYGVDTEIFIAQIDFENFLSFRAVESRYVPLSRFPSVSRDIAIVSDAEISTADLSDCIKKYGGKQLRSVTFFDVYTGASIPEGKKSTAFSLEFRSEESSLTDKETDAFLAAILEGLAKELNAQLR